MPPMRRMALLLLLSLPLAGSASQAPHIDESKIDAVFSRWTRDTPGCAVGVARGGKPVLQKAYGMADLEHDVPNHPTRSSKPGRSRSSSPPRRCCCSRRRASCRSTIRRASTCPSCPTTARRSRSGTCSSTRAGCATGERSPPSPAGRGRRASTRTRTCSTSLSRQKSLNFPPGTQYSYSNTRLQPRGDHRVARERQVVRRVLAATHLRAARHDPDVVARRLHADREGPGDRVRAGRRRVSA